MNISSKSMHNSNRCGLAFAVAAIMLCAATPALQAQSSISEPHTVFYGKVLGTASAQEFLVTDGQLEWTIQRSDGESVTLQTSLYPLNDNTYSYRLNVPHSALALGLSPDPGGVPLPPSPQVNVHAEVTVDGQVATLLGPAGSAFTTEQLLRTATYRMDLGLDREAVDSDGDGIPDWWEDLYGLDKQEPTDAAGDINGDGLSALDAYLLGIDPTRAARSPSLRTTDVIVYRAGSTAILLDTVDLDSSAEERVYTLTRLPYAGTLSLRNVVSNPEQPDQVLSEGAQFTQADMQNGRLIYDHDGSDNEPGSFAVEVRDEDPEHPADEGSINLLAYEPAALMPESLSALEHQRLDNYSRAVRGYVILDGSSFQTNIVLSTPSAGLTSATLVEYVAAYGEDRPYAIIGAAAASAVTVGGHQPDVLTAGEHGGTLTGGAAADRFIIQSFDSGLVTVTDFAPAELDVLDLSRMPALSEAYVHRHLRLEKDDGVYRLQADLDGDGAGFTNLAVALPSLTDDQADLYALIESGRIQVGSLQIEPIISLATTQARAAENGPTAGVITLTRRGSLIGDLTVNLLVTGSAQNGVDYQALSSTVIMPAGAASVDVSVLPISDGIAESTEDVRLTVNAGTGYSIDAAYQAVVTIEDLLMIVSIETVVPVAVKDTLTAGVLMITRSDLTDNEAIISLTISGTASNGTDYASISTQVILAANQTEAFLLVEPNSGAVLTDGLETVEIAIQASTDYLVALSSGQARVAIIERTESLTEWRSREFVASTDDAATFAAADSGSLGVSHLQRYAFGLDAHTLDRSGMPRPFMQNGRLVVTFRKPLRVQNDVIYRVSCFTDIMHPEESAVPMMPISAPVGSNDPEQVYYGADEAATVDASTVFSIIELEWVAK